jgi:hypothetical protein
MPNKTSSPPTDKLQYVGQISLSNVYVQSSTGVTLDVTSVTEGIVFFEDMYGTTSGKLIVKDVMSLSNVFPLIGTETVYFEAVTPGLPDIYKIKGHFVLYGMTEREKETDKSESYSLNFIPPEIVASANKSISKKYSGAISDIAQSIITNEYAVGSNGLPFVIQKTSNSIQYISNYWSPLRNLSFLADKAIAEFDGATNYLFFQNRYGLNFQSLSSIFLSSSPYQTFYADRFTLDPSSPQIDLNRQYQTVQEWSTIGTSYDYINALKSGLLGSTAYSFDPTRKILTRSRYDYDTSYLKTSHLNPKRELFGGAYVYGIDSKIYNIPSMYGNFTGSGNSTNPYQVQFRESLLAQMASNRLKIVVPGRTDYTVGQLVQFVRYKQQPTVKSTPGQIDELVSGQYVITAIEHLITLKDHTCIIELSSDT